MRNPDSEAVHASYKCQITFQNSHFIVVIKPAGWLSVPGREGDRDPRPVLGKVLEKQIGERVFPVHRLDFEVSGLILYARSPEAHRVANQWFENHSVRKTYLAWTEIGENATVPPVGVIQKWKCYIQRGKKRAFESPHGKESVTEATLDAKKIDNKGNPILQWRLHPLTGRPHQLRFELFRHGYSILGDVLYGAKTPFRENTIALQAVELDFSHCPDREKWGLPPAIGIDTESSALRLSSDSVL